MRRFPGISPSRAGSSRSRSSSPIRRRFGQPGTLIQATGPYQVNSFNPTTGLELSPNPNWWGGAIPVRHISVKVLKDETPEALAMRAGDLDITFPAIGTAFAKTAGSRIRVLSVGTSTVAYFGMNTKLAPWTDLHVRRAVAYALNRPQLVVANGGKGSATPESYFVPEFELQNLQPHANIKALLKVVPTYPYNLAKAKQELAKSAYPNGFTSFTNTVALVNFDIVSEAIAGELAKIGITLKVKAVDYGTWSDALFGEHGRTAPAIYSYIGAQSADPASLPGQSDLTGKDGRLMDVSDHDPTEIGASSATPRSRSAGLVSRVRRIPRGLLAIFRDPDFSPIEPRPLERPQVKDYSSMRH
jgi:peptide/nickel transport system substrate-binding protein